MMRPARLILACVPLCLPFSFASAQTKARVVHVFVALADNQHQGIIPVPAALGNGEDPAHNLYWGAAFGVRTFFKKSPEWKELSTAQKPTAYVLENSIFEHRTSGTILIADAYEGSEIKQALTDFFNAAAGVAPDRNSLTPPSGEKPPAS